MVAKQKEIFGTILGVIEAYHLPVVCWHHMQKHCLPWLCDMLFFFLQVVRVPAKALICY